MIPLPFLWKWLWVNFSPLDHQREGSPQQLADEDSCTGVGIAKDVVVQELLSTKEVNKADSVQASVFAKALIGRYLCVLFKDSVHCRTRFSDAAKTSLYTVRRTSATEREARLKEVPVFPQDLRVKILQELKEERLGRTSARNLLQLMTQPSPTSGSSKKPRLETSASTMSLMTTHSSSSLSPSHEQLSRSPSRSPSPPSPILVGGEGSGSQQQGMDLVVEAAAAAAQSANGNRKRQREEDEADEAEAKEPREEDDEEVSQPDRKRTTMAEPPARRSSFKRSVSMSSSTMESSMPGAGGGENGRPAQRVRLEPPAGSMASPSAAADAGSRGIVAPGAAGRSLAPMSEAAAMGRLLRRQVSTPVLPTQTAAPPAGGAAAMHQEPWKREINDLWAKQLAMLREINTLKNELGRREAARQREILGLRQEIDGLRGEVFRLRQVKGLKPTSSENLLAGAQKGGAAEGEQAVPAVAASGAESGTASETVAAGQYVTGEEQPPLSPGASAPATPASTALLPPPASPTRGNSAKAALRSITA